TQPSSAAATAPTHTRHCSHLSSPFPTAPPGVHHGFALLGCGGSGRRWERRPASLAGEGKRRAERGAERPAVEDRSRRELASRGVQDRDGGWWQSHESAAEADWLLGDGVGGGRCRRQGGQ
uniref:DUF834 domain-containing protein n=1 Tax=Oryza glaberrima TaxID=4538 RepID=I1QS42_ORYGL